MNKKEIFILFFISILIVTIIPLVYADNETSNITQENKTTNFEILNFIPQEFKIGDIQFNILIKNTGDTTLTNVIALITGKGFSTYDIVPIDSLKPGEKSYLLVMGNVKESGNITLTLKINDKLFYQKIKVTDPNSNIIAQQQIEQKLSLDILSVKLKELKDNYTSLSEDYLNKKNNNYDLSGIDLEGELRRLIRESESSIISNKVEQVNISLTLGFEEYNIQKEKLNNAKQIKKSFLSLIKDNMLFFSTIAASIITLFSFYELMKKKQELVSQQLTKKIKLLKENQQKTEEPKP